MAAPERFAERSDSFLLHRGRRPYMALMRPTSGLGRCLLIEVNRPLPLRRGNACFCEGFRMTAFVAMRRAPGPSSESLQRTNPRWGNLPVVPLALSYASLEHRYNFEVTARILLNGEFAFCTIRDFNELGMTKIAHKQLWRDESSRQSLNCIVRTDS
jgi:hypothetical protein